MITEENVCNTKYIDCDLYKPKDRDLQPSVYILELRVFSTGRLWSITLPDS
jgi:hypothetical protein